MNPKKTLRRSLQLLAIFIISYFVIFVRCNEDHKYYQKINAGDRKWKIAKYETVVFGIPLSWTGGIEAYDLALYKNCENKWCLAKEINKLIVRKEDHGERSPFDMDSISWNEGDKLFVMASIDTFRFPDESYDRHNKTCLFKFGGSEYDLKSINCFALFDRFAAIMPISNCEPEKNLIMVYEKWLNFFGRINILKINGEDNNECLYSRIYDVFARYDIVKREHDIDASMDGDSIRVNWIKDDGEAMNINVAFDGLEFNDCPRVQY